MKAVAMPVAAVLIGFAAPAWGQVCSASATGQAFGTYNPFNATVTTTTATVTVSCQATVSLLVSYTITLSGGGSGTVAARSMTSGTGSLPYQLYRDAAHTQVWGDGTAGSSGVADGYLLGVVAPVTRLYAAYGVIPAGYQVAPGMYGDTVVVMMTY